MEIEREQWTHIDYTAEFQRRAKMLQRIAQDPEYVRACKTHYKNDVVAFAMDWAVTYDPRNVGTGKPTLMPFILFEVQKEMLRWMVGMIDTVENGVVDKSRDMGATWLACIVAWWLWLFHDGACVGFGSRKFELVDNKDDPKCIFDKVRQLIKYTPKEFKPKIENVVDNLGKIINKERNTSIIGEGGDSIGRGGRTTLYVKDEAQKMSSKILTPWGWSTMGNMCEGALVIGIDGTPTKVIKVKDCGRHPVYRIGFSDGTHAECSPNHLWAVEQVIGNHKEVTLRTHEIAEKFQYDSPQGQTLYRYRVPEADKVQFAKGGELPLDPYVIGALIGDGCMAGTKTSYTITSADPEVVEEFERRLPDGIFLSHEKNKDITWRIVTARERGKGRRRDHNIFKKAIRDLKLAGKRSWEKHIPQVYLLASITERIDLLQGLMDTDGSASGTNVSYHTTSRQLAEDVRFLIQSLGGRASLLTKPDHRGFRDMYVLNMAFQNGIVPFKLERKIKLVKRRQPYGRTITSVELMPPEEVRCITVEAEDGLYLTDHCIVTHNSSFYDHPEKIEAALGENAKVQIDISTHNGTNTIFYRAVKNYPKHRVFTMDWSRDPRKDQAWFDFKRKEYRLKGLDAEFAREIERNPRGSVDNLVIPSHWIQAAVDAHIKLGLGDDPNGEHRAGLDIADGGADSNAIAHRTGWILRDVETWLYAQDPAASLDKAVGHMRAWNVDRLAYDSIGIGAGIKGDIRQRKSRGEIQNLVSLPFNAAKSPIFKDDEYHDGQTNGQVFRNCKSQSWWGLRTRFLHTYQAVMEDAVFETHEMISLDSRIKDIEDLIDELTQPTYTSASGKIVINKTPEHTRSPNKADSVDIVYAELEEHVTVSAPSIMGLY